MSSGLTSRAVVGSDNPEQLLRDLGVRGIQRIAGFRPQKIDTALPKTLDAISRTIYKPIRHPYEHYTLTIREWLMQYTNSPKQVELVIEKIGTTSIQYDWVAPYAYAGYWDDVDNETDVCIEMGIE